MRGIGKSFAVFAATSLCGSALGASYKDVCLDPVSSQITVLATPYRLEVRRNPEQSFWGDWERAYNAEIVHRVEEFNKVSPQASVVYQFISDGQQGIARKVGRVLAAGVVCTIDAPRRCRNRNFWGRSDIEPKEFAAYVFANTLLDQPALEECKRKAHPKTK